MTLLDPTDPIMDWLSDDKHKCEPGAGRMFNILLLPHNGYPSVHFRLSGIGANGLRHTTFHRCNVAMPFSHQEVVAALKEWYSRAELPLPTFLEEW